MASAPTAKTDLHQSVVQLRSWDDPVTLDRVPSDEDDVNIKQLYIDERLPPGD